MLARWEPFGGLRRRRDIFGDLFDMQEQMNRMFDEFFGERRTGLAEGNWTAPSWFMTGTENPARKS